MARSRSGKRSRGMRRAARRDGPPAAPRWLDGTRALFPKGIAVRAEVHEALKAAGRARGLKLQAIADLLLARQLGLEPLVETPAADGGAAAASPSPSPSAAPL